MPNETRVKHGTRSFLSFLVSGLLMAATLIATASVAVAHECNGGGHETCDAHHCPDDSETHYHVSRHWYGTHWCYSAPVECAFVIADLEVVAVSCTGGEVPVPSDLPNDINLP